MFDTICHITFKPCRLFGAVVCLLVSVGLSFTASAQCTRVGWVAEVDNNCGANIIDLDGGAVLQAVSGGEGLISGQTISFSYDTAAALPGCPSVLLPVALTCVSTTLPCTSEFVYFSDPNGDGLTVQFDADIYDANTQICQWNFGDGAISWGKQVSHTFSNYGEFNVCLTVSDGQGCSANTCKQVPVTFVNTATCGFDAKVTAVGLMLMGTLEDVANLGTGAVNWVRWYNFKTHQTIAQTIDFSYPLPDYGEYTICAEYQVTLPDGNICVNNACEHLVISEPGCIQPELVNGTAICPSIYAPVCGCNGITYNSECEARAAGVTTWWAGTCAENNSSTCQADLDYTVAYCNLQQGFWIKFTNLASGNYTNLFLDFGDGSPIHQGVNWDTITHFYPNPGIYQVNLTAWNNEENVSSVMRLISTDVASISPDNLPPGANYVYPGDANGDHVSNMYDLLGIGIGYTTNGAPRPNATNDWTPQMASNWPESTGDGVNYKHIDCDGNGNINEFDPGIILTHYTPLDTLALPVNEDLPVVYVDFAQDTIEIDPANPTPVSITGELKVANPAHPIFNFYGLALAVEYPEFVNHNTSANYVGEQFFGQTNYILWLQKNNFSRKQIDLGFVQKTGNGAAGFGKLATLNFQSDIIIIIDIGDRTESNLIPFAVKLTGVKAIDPNGIQKELTLPAMQDTVWIKLKETISTTEGEVGSTSLRLMPNPATEKVAVVVPADERIERLEVYNTLGQRVFEQTGDVRDLDVASWIKGAYEVKAFTAKRIISGKLLVQ